LTYKTCAPGGGELSKQRVADIGNHVRDDIVARVEIHPRVEVGNPRGSWFSGQHPDRIEKVRVDFLLRRRARRLLRLQRLHLLNRRHTHPIRQHLLAGRIPNLKFWSHLGLKFVKLQVRRRRGLGRKNITCG